MTGESAPATTCAFVMTRFAATTKPLPVITPGQPDASPLTRTTERLAERTAAVSTSTSGISGDTDGYECKQIDSEVYSRLLDTYTTGQASRFSNAFAA